MMSALLTRTLSWVDLDKKALAAVRTLSTEPVSSSRSSTRSGSRISFRASFPQSHERQNTLYHQLRRGHDQFQCQFLHRIQ
ncbi:hypothetical protein I7I48_04108 [Histoplasma ohiense]|nr:hypothetical protein I7I48_04108 [Histoplasma ohiense (nom. inval.)]